MKNVFPHPSNTSLEPCVKARRRETRRRTLWTASGERWGIVIFPYKSVKYQFVVVFRQHNPIRRKSN